MQIGIVLPNLGPLATPDAMIAIAERAEQQGFADVWTSDHLAVPIESQASYPYVRRSGVRLDPSHPIIDPMIALAGIATRTERIRLGVSVYLAALRHPIVAARLVASLDRLSRGRVCLGVGAGWIPEEYEMLGIAFRERGAVLDEHIACMRALWTEPQPQFSGQYYQLENLGFEPKPVQSRLPIWVGGNSAPARRRAARAGDGWHVIDVPLPDLEVGIADLHRLCREAGRNPADVVVSMRAQVSLTPEPVAPADRFAPLIGTREQVIHDLRAMEALGVGHVALWPAGRIDGLEHYLERIDELASEVMPAITGAASA